MITLTNFASFWRRASVFTALGIGGILILFVLFLFGKSIRNSLFPPPPPTAIVAFGKLPKTDFSDGIRQQGTINYKIETISGELPQLSTSAKVFAISASNSSFGKLEDVKKKAQSIGFTLAPQIIPQGFRFVDAKDSSRIFTVDSSSGDFLYQTSLQGISKPKSTDDAIGTARTFFNNFNLSDKEFPYNRVYTTNLKFSASDLVPASSLSSSDLVRVDFYRADVDKLPILPIADGKSQVVAQVTDKGIVGAKMNIYNLERFKFATYPLKGVTKAYTELQNGQGVFNANSSSDTFEITNINLGYVESSKTSQYLTPVYIFTSRGSLKAFIDAVDDAWISR
ncbi:MAG: hypothetical protein Q7S45_03595 [Candidatus Curtissbacteria bacterium]|nr:hypothetical protein [Candidatus Curtissbacteria bacterium]